MIRHIQIELKLWIVFLCWLPLVSIGQQYTLFDSLYRQNSKLMEMDTLKKYAVYQLKGERLRGTARVDWYSTGKCETIIINESDSIIFKEETNFYTYPAGKLNQIKLVSKRYVYYPHIEPLRLIKTFFYDYNGDQKQVMILEAGEENELELDFDKGITFFPRTDNANQSALNAHYQRLYAFVKIHGYIFDYEKVRGHIHDSKRYFDFISADGCPLQLNGAKMNYTDSLYTNNRSIAVIDFLNQLYVQTFNRNDHPKEVHFLFAYSYWKEEWEEQLSKFSISKVSQMVKLKKALQHYPVQEIRLKEREKRPLLDSDRLELEINY